MSQASQLIASQYRNAEYNRRIWSGVVYNVKEYGAIGNGVTDDTLALQTLINTIDSGRIFFPKGDYFLTRQGMRLLSYSNTERHYSLLLANKKNISFWFEPGARIKMDMSDTFVSCAFWLDGCSDILFEGPSFIGYGQSNTLMLEEGIGISIDKSKRVSVYEARSENMRGCARSYNSENVFIADGFSTVLFSVKSTAHFALYQSKDSTIDNCTTYGSTLDGDTFIFGGGSTNCVISNCRSHAYEYGDANRTINNPEAQGIMVDSGGRNCKIIDCYAYGYFYGFDIKNGTEGGVIQGCTAEKCKVGISSRKGEGTSPNNFVSVLGNTVIPNGGNGNTNPLIGPIGDPIGIFTIDCYGGAVIDGNTIYNSIDSNGNHDFYGTIIGISDNLFEADMGTFVISNNSFSLQNKNGALSGTSQKSAVLVTTQYRMVNVSITGNTFDLPQSGMIQNLLDINNVYGLSITNNSFSVTNTKGLPIIKLTGCVRSVVNGNNFGFHFGMLHAISGVGLTFNGNVSGDTIGGPDVPAILLDNVSYVTINSNVQIVESGQSKDAEYFVAKNGSNWLVVTNNMIKIANKDSTNWYTSTAANYNIANNVID